MNIILNMVVRNHEYIIIKHVILSEIKKKPKQIRRDQNRK